MEGAQALVPPQVQQRALAAQPARLGAQHALRDLGEVAQVERVVRLGGIGRSARGDLVVQHDGRLDERLDALAHLARRPLDEAAEDAAKDRAQRAADGCGRQSAWWWRTKRGVSGLRPPPGGPHAHTTVTSATSFQKGLRAVVDAAAVEEQPQQLDGRRGAVRLERGHVDVVDEEREPLARRRAEHGAPPLVEPLLDHRLRRARRRLRREVELHAEPLAALGELARTRCVRTDLPTPEPPQSSVGLAASRLADSRKADRTVSTVGTRTSKKGIEGVVRERRHQREPRRERRPRAASTALARLWPWAGAWRGRAAAAAAAGGEPSSRAPSSLPLGWRRERVVVDAPARGQDGAVLVDALAHKLVERTRDSSSSAPPTDQTRQKTKRTARPSVETSSSSSAS